MCKCLGIKRSFVIKTYEGTMYEDINDMITDDIIPKIIVLAVLCPKDKFQDTQNKNNRVIMIEITPVDINSSAKETLSRNIMYANSAHNSSKRIVGQ